MKVLVAEDDMVLQTLLEGLLTRWGYHVVLAADGLEAWEILNEPDAPELAILDWMMPGIDGIQICADLRRRESGAYVYVLLLTSKSNPDDVVSGLESGVDDYLTKPFNNEELRARIAAGSRIVDLQRALLSVQEELRDKATHDALTGVWNRGTIMEMFNHELNRSSRHSDPLSVVLADVDHFKQVNDTLGHQAGDVVLREVAQRMRLAVRSYDAVGRFGGEEFLILLPRCTTAEAMATATRLRLAMEHVPITVESGQIEVTLSLGVTSTEDTGTYDVDALMRQVDTFLYQAKRSGRNRVYGPGMWAMHGPAVIPNGAIPVAVKFPRSISCFRASNGAGEGVAETTGPVSAEVAGETAASSSAAESRAAEPSPETV